MLTLTPTTKQTRVIFVFILIIISASFWCFNGLTLNQNNNPGNTNPYLEEYEIGKKCTEKPKFDSTNSNWLLGSEMCKKYLINLTFGSDGATGVLPAEQMSGGFSAKQITRNGEVVEFIFSKLKIGFTSSEGKKRLDAIVEMAYKKDPTAKLSFIQMIEEGDASDKIAEDLARAIISKNSKSGGLEIEIVSLLSSGPFTVKTIQNDPLEPIFFTSQTVRHLGRGQINEIVKFMHIKFTGKEYITVGETLPINFYCEHISLNPAETVLETGAFNGLEGKHWQMLDKAFALELTAFFRNQTVLDFGGGTGQYARILMESGIQISCYDGNPETQIMSDGRCALIDLAKPIKFMPADWILSLEVGEHIPKEWEEVYINNLVKNAKHGIVLSWAIKGQGGHSHVNTQNNDYVRELMEVNGFISDFETEKRFRKIATLGYFKNTLMVFRRK